MELFHSPMESLNLEKNEEKNHFILDKIVGVDEFLGVPCRELSFVPLVVL